MASLGAGLSADAMTAEATRRDAAGLDKVADLGDQIQQQLVAEQKVSAQTRAKLDALAATPIIAHKVVTLAVTAGTHTYTVSHGLGRAYVAACFAGSDTEDLVTAMALTPGGASALGVDTAASIRVVCYATSPANIQLVVY